MKLDHIKQANALLPDEVILHIGMTKAGSTAIQNAFEQNHEYLFNQGVLFPRSVFHRNTHTRDRTPGHLRLITRCLRENSLDGLIEELGRARENVNKIVLSAENLFHDAEDADLSNLARLLEGKSTRIVILLRSQPEWLASRYYQAVVGGHNKECRSFEEFVTSRIEDGTLNYHRRINYVARLIGAEHLSVYDYDRIQRAGGSVTVMLREAGLDEGGLPFSVSRYQDNVSRPFPEWLEAHRRLNLVARHLPLIKYQKWCKEIETAAADTASRHRLEPSHIKASETLRQRILDACEESNLELSRQFFNGRPFASPADSVEREDPMPANEHLVNEMVNRGLALLEPYVTGSTGSQREMARVRSERDAARVELARADEALDLSRRQHNAARSSLAAAIAERDHLARRLVETSEAMMVGYRQLDAMAEQFSKLSNDLITTEGQLAGSRACVDDLESRLASAQLSADQSRVDAQALEHNLKQLQIKAKKDRSILAKERDAFIAYADKLEIRITRVLQSRTWRLMGPYRATARKISLCLILSGSPGLMAVPPFFRRGEYPLEIQQSP